MTTQPNHNLFNAGVPNVTFRDNPIIAHPDGTYSVQGVKMFRVGTFRDSMGEQHTYTHGDLEMLVEHFDTLNKIGFEPPVRKDHSFSVEKVMGYFEDLRVEDGFLVVDYRVPDAADVQKLASGLFRNVSAEIGVYSDNDDNTYYPVVMGVAYVDIPAIEGLFTTSNRSGDNAGSNVATCVNGLYQGNDFSYTTSPSTTSYEISPDTGGGWFDHWVASQPEITYFSRIPTGEEPVSTQNFSFTIGGEATEDYAKVQSYVKDLEEKVATQDATIAERDETIAQHDEFMKGLATKDRHDYVSALVADNKITSPTGEKFKAMVESMDDAQFEAFKAGYDEAPTMRQFEQHGSGDGDGGKGEQTADEQAYATAAAQVAHLRRGPMTEEQLKSTRAFRTMTELAEKLGK